MRMRTFATEPAVHVRNAGFTLIELLAVMAVMALAVTAFSYTSSGSLESTRFRALVVKASAALQATRVSSIRKRQEQVFRIDIERRAIGVGDSGLVLELPAGVELAATVASSERYNDGSVGIRFFPSGGSTGGKLTFTHAGTKIEIRVNWLTGSVLMNRG